MWIPDGLYKILPAVYAVAGSVCLLASGWEGPAVLSAVTLLAAAATTALWRHRAAAGRRQAQTRYSARGRGVGTAR